MKKVAAILAGLLMMAGSAWALPYGGNPASLQGIFDDITVSGNSSVNAETDYLGFDTTWAISGSGGSVATLIIEIAGLANENRFGIYQGSNQFDIFGGSAVSGYQALVSILADGTVTSVIKNASGAPIAMSSTAAGFFSGNSFGYYLANNTNTFYSDDTKNIDEKDHMLAYQGTGDLIQIDPYAAGTWGPNEYILAFEDLPSGSTDWDYNDFVVMVESVAPVPEPGTIVLLGAGLLGLGIYGRRRAKK